jgi:hypothetical protein
MSKLEDIVKIQEEVSAREGRKVSILEAAMRYDHPWLFTGPKIAVRDAGVPDES